MPQELFHWRLSELHMRDGLRLDRSDAIFDGDGIDPPGLGCLMTGVDVYLGKQEARSTCIPRVRKHPGKDHGKHPGANGYSLSCFSFGISSSPSWSRRIRSMTVQMTYQKPMSCRDLPGSPVLQFRTKLMSSGRWDERTGCWTGCWTG